MREEREGGREGGRENERVRMREKSYYAWAYLRRKLFARGGKRINVAAQLLRAAFRSQRRAASRRCFSNNDVAGARSAAVETAAVTNIKRDFNFFKLAIATAANLLSRTFLADTSLALCLFAPRRDVNRNTCFCILCVCVCVCCTHIVAGLAPVLS